MLPLRGFVKKPAIHGRGRRAAVFRCRNESTFARVAGKQTAPVYRDQRARRPVVASSSSSSSSSSADDEGGGEQSEVVANGEDSVDGEEFEVEVEEEEDGNDLLDAGMAMNARSNSVLKSLIEEQSELLGSRSNPLLRKRVSTFSRKRFPYESSSEAEVSEAEGSDKEAAETPESRLTGYLRTLPADFFKTAEAKMLNSIAGSSAATDLGSGGVEDGSFKGLARRRGVPYAGLALSHEPENCPDLTYCFQQAYEIGLRRSGRKESYYQFKSVVGQLARFAVAVNIANADSFWRMGALFKLMTSSDLIRAFIGGFQKNAQASTVYSKATLLGGLCRMAKLHFGKTGSPGTAAILCRIDETANLLGGFRRVEKATSRRQTAVRRDQDRRVSFIHATDWYALQKRIADDMTNVWSGVADLVAKFGSKIEKYLDEMHSLVRKYSLLLLIYILLNGGGQRPQVYTSLQHPTEAVLHSWEAAEEARLTGKGRPGEDFEAVKLYPGQEKTPRGTFYPGIVFPLESRAFFICYSRFVRPAIMRRQDKDLVDEDLLNPDRTFLVHTETGMALSGDSLKNTLRTYAGGLNGLRGDLSLVTVMTVRASFASVMFRAFRQGKFAPKTTEEFLDDLAEVMNTSLEMLRTTYIATDGKEFEEAANAFLRASRED
jgi:hypothetical protein